MSASSTYADAASLTHSSDIDGLASAAFVKMRFGIGAKRIFFCDYTPESLLYASERIKPLCRPGFTLFITDIGMNAGLEKAFVNLLSYINKKGGKAVWFDHHPWSEGDISKVAKLCQIAIIGENRRYCATEITRKMLGLNDGFSIKLAEIVHYSDFNLKPDSRNMKRLIGAYALSISSYSTMNRRDAYAKLRNMAVLLSCHKLISSSIKADAAAFSKLNRLRVSKMLGELYVYGNVAIGFGETIQSTNACAEIMKKSGKDIGIYINTESNKGHMRSVKADCSGMAKRLGGGGHPHACGFPLRAPEISQIKTKSGRSNFSQKLAYLARDLPSADLPSSK